MISVRNVSKSFGPQRVLNNVSIEIALGQTTAIVGPSGVGKSVLIKLIMGILTPDSGEIWIGDRCISKASSEAERNEIRSKIGVLFQSAALFDSLSVFDNIAFPLVERSKLTTKEIQSKVYNLLEALSLKENASHYPQQISIGTRKRVGMARALIYEPNVILFDEPNTGLDPLVGQEVYDLIKLCRSRWHFSGVVVSHELPEVFQVSDRVVMLLKGQVIADASTEEFASSSNPAVQQFLHGRRDGPIQIQ
jgi:phospholipid/cholesterol/gamma-HCH transport system ATP-binding protein